jgi:DNA-binding response OmpR family regulator
MPHHACFAVPDRDLDVVIVDDNKSMQGILRSMLTAMKVKRIRVFDSAEEAFHVMMSDPPNLILSEWTIGGVGGQQFLRMLRARFLDPMCFVPVIIITAGATASVVEKAMLAGAHLLMAKPISTAALTSRIAFLQHDEREFVLGARGSYEIEGVGDRVKNQKDRSRVLKRVAARRSEDGVVRVAAPPLRHEVVDAQSERWRAFLKAKEAAARATGTPSPEVPARPLGLRPAAGLGRGA